MARDKKVIKIKTLFQMYLCDFVINQLVIIKIGFFMPVNYAKEFLKSIHTGVVILLPFFQSF